MRTCADRVLATLGASDCAVWVQGLGGVRTETEWVWASLRDPPAPAGRPSLLAFGEKGPLR